MRAGRRQHPLEEAVQDPERVLDAVPPGQRDDHRVPVPVRRPVAVQHRGTAGERRGGPIGAVVAGSGGRDSGGQAKVLQDHAGGAIGHRQVLRRPGVDARRHDRRLRPAQPLRQRGVAAEHEAAHAGQARPQAPPRVRGVLVVMVDADLAAPDDGRASPLQRPRHRCRLGIVQHHHVSGGDQRRQRPGVIEGSPVQRRQPLDPEHAAIAWLALQMVMKPPGHPEELARTAQHHPPHVDASALPVRQQRTKQLRNPATQSGRVHHPDRPPAQQLTGVLLGHAHPLDHRLPQVAAEIPEMPGLQRNLGKSISRSGHTTRIRTSEPRADHPHRIGCAPRRAGTRTGGIAGGLREACRPVSRSPGPRTQN